MSERSGRKSIARSLGECVGHIARGIRSSGTESRTEVHRHTEVAEQDGVVLRRTVVEEVELRQDHPRNPSNQASTSQR